MNRSILLSFFSLLIFSSLSAQEVSSNKGTDFWVGYMDHIDGTSSFMSLYITSDISTTGTVSIPGAAWSSSYVVTANVTTIVSIPPLIAFDGCSDCISNNGIHIVSADPVVVYAHIYSSPRSDATLVLPVPSLGKDYWIMSYPQHPSITTERSVFLIVAVEDNTTVEITPGSTTLGGSPAGVPFTVTLNQGQMYQVESFTDVTGSRVISQGGSGSCKRIAVFSGSTFNRVGCVNASTGDNLFEQDYQTNSWGKEFITAPFLTRLGDLFRVLAGTNGTVVSFNGTVTATLNAGQVWDTITAVSNYISASEPVALAQFMLTQNCDGVLGDPSMLILSPVEQTLDTITLYSSPFMAITGEYINVIMKTSDTATFSLDGSHVPFFASPFNTFYSYAQNTVTTGNHTLLADSGFTASAYGMGNLESYAYNAGANVSNLQQSIVLTSNGVPNTNVACPGSQIHFNPLTSYVPLSWLWYFGDGDTSSFSNPAHAYSDTGNYSVALVTLRSGVVGCNATDSSSAVVHVVSNPSASFSFITACVGDSTFFSDSSTQGGSVLNYWLWKFGDGDSSFAENPGHIYTSSGTYQTSVIIETDIGCSDTLVKPLVINPLPIANAGNDTLICAGASTVLVASGGVHYQWLPSTGLSSDTVNDPVALPSTGTYYQVIVTDTSGCSSEDSVYVEIHFASVNAGSDQRICKGSTTTLSGSGAAVYSWAPSGSLLSSTGQIVLASPADEMDFYLQGVDIHGCTGLDTVHIFFDLPPKPAFTAEPTTGPWPLKVEFSNSTTDAVSYLWKFGDGDSSTILNPDHIYRASGSYEVLLIAVSAQGCTDTSGFRYIITDNSNKILIPNIFSMNGDGVNDMFKISNAGFSELTGEIYNRWGNLIVTKDFLSDGWDGKSKNGADVPEGVYFYILHAKGHDGKLYEYNGMVELIH